MAPLLQVLAYVVAHPEVQDRVHEEAQRAGATGGKSVTLADRTQMPYTEGVVLEAIRLIASPIVPHVANQDASVAGEERSSSGCCIAVVDANAIFFFLWASFLRLCWASFQTIRHQSPVHSRI